jgi:hypothetical protein
VAAAIPNAATPAPSSGRCWAAAWPSSAIGTPTVTSVQISHGEVSSTAITADAGLDGSVVRIRLSSS